MSDIYYNYPQMKKIASAINGIESDFRELEKMMDNIVAVSNKGFTGDSQKAFQTAHMNVINRYKKMDDYLNDLSSTIIKAKNQTQKSDADTAERVRKAFASFL